MHCTIAYYPITVLDSTWDAIWSCPVAISSLSLVNKFRNNKFLQVNVLPDGNFFPQERIRWVVFSALLGIAGLDEMEVLGEVAEGIVMFPWPFSGQFRLQTPNSKIQ